MSARNKLTSHTYTYLTIFFVGFALSYFILKNIYKLCKYIHISIIQGETDTQLQYQMEYAVVDKSKKKNKKGDKQQSVSIQQ